MTDTFASRLRSLRERAGLTPSALARKAGLTPQAIYDLESGNRADPRFGTVCALARALGVSTEELRPEPEEEK